MIRIAKLHSRTWLIVVVGIIALVGGFVLAQAPEVSAAVKSISRLAIPAIPATINYQGHLRDENGAPANGTFDITARVYDAAAGGNQLYIETLENVNVRDGLFNIVLGDINPLGTTFEGAPRYVGITLDGSELMPHERVHGVPWAIYATNALHADTAGFATTAGNATTAGFATSAGTATTADGISGIGCCDTYTAGDVNSGIGETQHLNFWPDNGMCVLTKVQSAVIQAASCEIDWLEQDLVAGPFSYCEVECISIGD